MFHLENGLCFERIKSSDKPEFYGGVRICRLQPNEDMRGGAGETVAIISASSWASICASMSALGENGTTHRMYEALQRG